MSHYWRQRPIPTGTVGQSVRVKPLFFSIDLTNFEEVNTPQRRLTTHQRQSEIGLRDKFQGPQVLDVMAVGDAVHPSPDELGNRA